MPEVQELERRIKDAETFNSLFEMQEILTAYLYDVHVLLSILYLRCTV